MSARLVLAAALAVLALAPAPAAALQSKVTLVAYGEGVTTCVVTTNMWEWFNTGGTDGWYLYYAKTECSAPLEQTAQVKIERPTTPVWGALCSGFRAVCESDGTAEGEDGIGAMNYRITLRAPRGQGWIASPEQCSGAGTDNLTCTFQPLGETDLLLLNRV